MSSSPLLIEETNLSHAWAKILLHIIDNPGKEISPLVVSLTGFSKGIPLEDNNIQSALEVALINEGQQGIKTVANTIFPESLWRRSGYDRKDLFQRYISCFLPRAKAMEPHKNSRGLYFERMISFDTGPYGNQLEHIITEYLARPAVRRTMFQASIFDPGRDHTRMAQLPFPCLQHVSFIPHKDTLTLNAFYATQQVFNKAYGNYLGLTRLGRFMAHEMKLELSRVNCFVGVAKLERISKSSTELAPVINVCRNAVEQKNN